LRRKQKSRIDLYGKDSSQLEEKGVRQVEDSTTSGNRKVTWQEVIQRLDRMKIG
jgi:hypothetical protein